MLVAFFESLKYVGHLLPLSFLRLYLGYYFISRAVERFDGDFLLQPRLASAINTWLPQSNAPDWYRSLVQTVVLPQWQIFSYTITYAELLIGISFLIGFAVRPMAILGMFLMINFIYISSPDVADLYKVLLVTFLAMAWLGAGRCFGLDYFFFKRHRGIWW